MGFSPKSFIEATGSWSETPVPSNLTIMLLTCFVCVLISLTYISLIQLPVAQAVPSAVGLVPPTFPVTMSIPPPGYGPPPFIRAGFNTSQPPPGK